MEEKTLQPSAGEENKPQNKKTIKLKEKNNDTKKGLIKPKSIKKSPKKVEKTSAVKKSKILKKETAKKKSEKTKEKVSSTKSKILKKETAKKKSEKTKEKVSSTKSKILKKETAKKKSDKIENSKKTKEKNSLKEKKGEIVKESNYSSNSIEDLIKIYQELSAGEAWLKNHKSLQSVNHQFNVKFQLEAKEQKKKFLSEGGNEIDFFI